MSTQSYLLSSAAETTMLGTELARQFKAGDTVLVDGPLGAGKTTLIRGILEGLDFHGTVRSPTFNLIQTFPTDPPVMHADLYRLKSHEGIGIEDYLDTHLCLIEWPDRAVGLRNPAACWRIDLTFEGEGRRVTVAAPTESE